MKKKVNKSISLISTDNTLFNKSIKRCWDGAVAELPPRKRRKAPENHKGRYHYCDFRPNVIKQGTQVPEIMARRRCNETGGHF